MNGIKIRTTTELTFSTTPLSLKREIHRNREACALAAQINSLFDTCTPSERSTPFADSEASILTMPSSPRRGRDHADRPRRRLSIVVLLVVALLDARFAMALSSANGASTLRSIRVGGAFRPSHHANLSGAAVRISSESPFFRGALAPRQTTTTRIGGALWARRPQRDEEEVFQRSLLEAKIANDIKDTIIKDERQRNEVVAKQIGLVKEELQDAVKEVKEAVQEVSQSAKSLGGAVIGSASTKKAAREYAKSALNLGGAFVGSAPKIFANLVKLSATSETR